MTPEEPKSPVAKVHVCLYIAGASPNSVAALANLRIALAPFSDQFVAVQIIDVLVDPQRGLRDGILITPMLVRTEPLPERRILGNLSDRVTLLSALGLAESPS